MKVLTLLLVMSITVALGQAVYFQDDFNDGNADGWFEQVTGAYYEVVDYKYQFTADSGSFTRALSFNSDNTGGMSVADYSILSEMCAHSPTHAMGSAVRANYSQETGYVAYLRVYQNEVVIYRMDSSGNEELAQEPITLDYDQFYWVRFTCIDSLFRLKIWTGVPADEPEDWLISVEDGTYTDPGYFCIGSWNLSSNSGLDAEFDNVTVSEPVPLALTQLTWAMIKSVF